MKSYFGQGISFPFRFSVTGGTVISGNSTVEAALQHVFECLRMLLGTRVGERVMRRDYGSGMFNFVFQLNDPQLQTMADYYIRRAIQLYEPRVIVGDIILDGSAREQGILRVSIDVTLIQMNVRGNLVWDYYLSDTEKAQFGAAAVPGV